MKTIGFGARMRRSGGDIVWLVSALFACSSAAQTALTSSAQTNASPQDATSSPARLMTMQTDRWKMGVAVDYSYVAGGRVSYLGLTGDSDAQCLNAIVTAQIPLNDQWFVPLRIGSHDFFLGSVAGVPIPDQIDTVGFEAGLGYHFNGQWTLAASVGPLFYRFDDIHSDDIGVNGTILATFNAQPNLTVGFGMNVQPDRQVPVLPAAGVRWGIRTNLDLNLVWPTSGLFYHVQRRFDVFVGVGGNYTVFRTGQNLGNTIGQPGFNNALGTYRDFHIGAGAEYRLLHGLSVAVQGGYSVGREIDYTRIDQTVSFGAGPYAQIWLRSRF